MLKIVQVPASEVVVGDWAIADRVNGAACDNPTASLVTKIVTLPGRDRRRIGFGDWSYFYVSSADLVPVLRAGA